MLMHSKSLQKTIIIHCISIHRHIFRIMCVEGANRYVCDKIDVILNKTEFRNITELQNIDSKNTESINFHTT